MKSPLRILHLEDDPIDAGLVLSAFEAGGIKCSITCVQNRRDFVAALKSGEIDLILLDITLPAFDGMSAARLVRMGWPAIPVIIVSGTLGEELAIDSLKNGATDYVLKERLSRLVPAVRRAMLEVEALEERWQVERQLTEARKMDVVGKLATGVAHDFNNLLSVIIGYCDLIKSDLPPESPLQKYSEEIQHASLRAAGLTRQLLVFSRKQTVHAVVLDINETVKNLDKMLHRLIDKNIEMTILTEKETGRVKADIGYIEQLLINLVLNARDAMPNGGKLIITSKNVTLDKNSALPHPQAIPGDYVMLSVSDSGTGMTEEVKAQLFEAFFTTKPVGEGTGLGLATCRTIVEQSGGHLDFDSKIGTGTVFKTYFPRVEEPLEFDEPRIPPATSLRRTRHGFALADESCTASKTARRVLVVEDDINIREVTTEMLIRSGYMVDTAADGAAGWTALRKRQYDLVITDNFMPNLTGMEMVRNLRAARMTIPVIMATGLLPSEEFDQHDWAKTITTLPKPFTISKLLSTVTRVMAAAQNSPPESEQNHPT
jgi:two-component system, cell cycle sensor histidine kinase and response regulator CckA